MACDIAHPSTTLLAMELKGALKESKSGSILDVSADLMKPISPLLKNESTPMVSFTLG